MISKIFVRIRSDYILQPTRVATAAAVGLLSNDVLSLPRPCPGITLFSLYLQKLFFCIS
jgi:hypothetical protein